MSVNKLIENRIKELQRDIIPDAIETIDVLHNEKIREYIDIYEQALDNISRKKEQKETTWVSQDIAATHSTTN